MMVACILCIADDIPCDEEVGREVELADDFEFVAEAVIPAPLPVISTPLDDRMEPRGPARKPLTFSIQLKHSNSLITQTSTTKKGFLI